MFKVIKEEVLMNKPNTNITNKISLICWKRSQMISIGKQNANEMVGRNNDRHQAIE